jgi:transposase-like protein
MRKTTNKPTLIPKMYCNLFGHDYQVTKKVTLHVKEYTCRHCKKELTTNSNGHLIELTPKFREINDILERIYTSRTERLKNRTLSSPIY